jgi:DNA-binding phage protein
MVAKRRNSGASTFWDDLARDLENPEFLREYVVESMRIATIDQLVNDLDDARVAAGMSKAELARAISAEPASVRRLFSSGAANPTLGTLAEVAAALGMRVTLEALPDVERDQVTTTLLAGRAADPRALAAFLTEKRRRRGPAAIAP